MGEGQGEGEGTGEEGSMEVLVSLKEGKDCDREGSGLTRWPSRCSE